MKRSTLGRVGIPAAVVLSLGLSACAAGNEPSGGGAAGEGGGSGLSGSLDAAGASTQQAAMQAWIADFGTANPDVTVNYDPAGSSAGREQFLDGGIDFAGSDAYLDDEELALAEERCPGGTAVSLPVYVSPIAVVYNLEGVDTVQMSPATLAKVFDQKITDWSDPAIAADNGGTALPAGPITVVNRGEGSGTTENFLEYLAATAPADWPYEVSDEWPVAGGEAAQGTSGVISAVQAGAGSIGYADLSQIGELGTVSVQVGEEYVVPTPEAAATALDASTPAEGRPEGDLALDIDRTTTEGGAYPVVLASYQIACTSYETQEEADLVKAFIGYVVSEEGQAAAADAAGSAPISDELRTQVEASLESITTAS